MPLSFDAGFSQLTTAFHAGARVVLLNYLMPRDVLKALEREKVTGLTAVPPLYIQLTQLEWPAAINRHLRYFANTGGRMPRETLNALRQRAPSAKPFLMYGLTEAFRSTYLPPDEVDRRPDSIGKAIPNAEILVLREDGSPCGPNEPGELVHRGALVGQGYWNDAAKTAERYKLLPTGAPGREAGLQLPEYAVFSGDNVRMDEDGFLYFIGRRDEMMKTSGYRVSPTEVEEILYATKLVGECVAFGVEHPTLGQAIQVIATMPEGPSESVTRADTRHRGQHSGPTPGQTGRAEQARSRAGAGAGAGPEQVQGPAGAGLHGAGAVHGSGRRCWSRAEADGSTNRQNLDDARNRSSRAPRRPDRRPDGPVQGPYARLHGALGHRVRGRAAAAQPQWQDRPQGFVHRMVGALMSPAPTMLRFSVDAAAPNDAVAPQ